jgi:hypothetical protein
MTSTEQQEVREKLRSVFKWLYTTGDMDTDEVVEYTIIHARRIMEEAIEEFHDYLEWE